MKNLCVLCVSVVGWVAASAAEPDAKAIEAAIGKSLVLLEKSSVTYPTHRTCFSCHHQALPPMTLALARERGFTVDAKAMREQSELTHEFFSNRREKLPKGGGVPGGSYTTGYALLALAADGWPADEITGLMVQHLLKRQEKNGRWRMGTKRPPLEYSDFTSTALSLRGLQLFTGKEKAEETAKRVARGRKWLLAAKPKENEDRIWHLLGLKWSGAKDEAIANAAKTLLSEQRPDGGWAQTPKMKSDPYATGQALAALHLAGGLPVKDKRWRKGIAWLLRAQKPDGSWYVKSRSKPFQKYFESGYPHGKDQFISICAGSWATMALLLTRPPAKGQQPTPLSAVAVAAKWDGIWQAAGQSECKELKCVASRMEGDRWAATFTGVCSKRFSFEVKMTGRQLGPRVVFEGRTDLGKDNGGVTCGPAPFAAASLPANTNPTPASKAPLRCGLPKTTTPPSMNSELRWAMAALLASALLADAAVFPEKTWARKSPAETGLDAAKLNAFSRFVGGRGCVVRHGVMVYSWGEVSRRADVASAAKPFYAHFLFKAVEDGKVKSLDEAALKWEPRLKGFDRGIAWRHFANQTSCYQLAEKPGTAYAYNDWQMALFWDTLFLKVYSAKLDTVDAKVFRPLLMDRLQCEDRPTLMAFGARNRAGRVGISVRDFARFGLLYLRQGNWRGQQLLDKKLAVMAVTSPLPNTIPRAGRKAAPMIPGQRSMGSRSKPDNQTDHFGSYSWLWWINGVDRRGTRFWPDAPHDTFGAFGHGGPRAMWVMPSLDIVVSYNDAQLRGWNSGAKSPTNQAMKRLVAAVKK